MHSNYTNIIDGEDDIPYYLITESLYIYVKNRFEKHEIYDYINLPGSNHIKDNFDLFEVYIERKNL